ncbi:uncharacterized protein N7503_006995 [Penicillium pulvis]|uniref:Uncharacterized protein n=1 Tax=Penicillium frequentans TaxID=3151616 RepID=A0AAD6CTQ9_9EURO|nr:uncharacterized protein N7503_006995 [Penicillium pulvis]KAJ5538488.1 hypothetical protein N7494_007967 [Penicillium glabrum]KAJ5549200.1 hypothetical protein N7513_006434 [Penicillium glabrum]KAJ5797699.1 hypothetical protein N7503_006995 [Penicillium pulvis]
MEPPKSISQTSVAQSAPPPMRSRRPSESPGGFAQFLLMIMGYEVLLQHRSMGSGMAGKEE